MNCFVSKQPNWGELIIIMKSSSINAAVELLARETGHLGKWAVASFLSFPEVIQNVSPTEIRNLPFSDGHC